MDIYPMWIIYLFVFVLGTIFGSFFNVLIYRLPRKESIVFPPSRCPKCGTQIKPYDNIPIISFIALKGKCRYCKEPISIRYPIIEFLTGILFLSGVILYGVTWIAITYIWLFAILWVISIIDFETMLVPDSLVITGLLGGTLFNIILQINVSRIDAIIGAIVGAFIIILIRFVGKKIYKMEVMGAGDIGIYSLIGLFMGYKSLLSVMLIGAFIGSVVGVSMIKLGKKGMRSAIPFGPFLSIGALITWIFAVYLKSWGILW